MKTFENKSIKILEKNEIQDDMWLCYEDFVVRKLGNNKLEVIKDRTGELSS